MPRFTPVDWRTLERVFLAAGFQFARQEGSHRAYVREGVSRPVVIPTYSEVPVFMIGNNPKRPVCRAAMAHSLARSRVNRQIAAMINELRPR
jgi:predicted RNA binding protein YcfA (HicA-like mRNA interferase family)